MTFELSSVAPAEGWQDVQVGSVVVSVPAGWQAELTEDDGLLDLQVRHDADIRTALTVSSVTLEETDLELGLDDARDLAGPSAEEHAVELAALSADGEVTALDGSYQEDGDEARTWSLVFAHHDRLYIVTLLRPSSDFSEPLARSILGTIRDA